MATDAELLEAYAGRGDVESLSAFVGRHSRRVMVFLEGMLHSRAEAEDCFQETWLRVMQRGKGYRGGGAVAWVLAIARSIALDRMRREGRLVSLDAENAEGERLVAEPEAREPPPPESAGYNLMRSEVLAEIRRLPLAQREVLMLRIEGGLEFREIAEATGAPLGSVLTRMHLAKQALMRKFGGT